MFWALFSEENDYNQPLNNLVGIWLTKPSFEVLGGMLTGGFPAAKDEHTLAIVHLWEGRDVRLRDTDYRLRAISEGFL